MLSCLTETNSGDYNPGSKKGEIDYRWVVVASLFIIGFVAFGVRFSFGVFFKSLQKDFLLGRATTSSIFSVYLALSALFSILGGWALDRFGARKVFAVTGFFTSLSLFLTSMVTALWQLFLTYSFLLALGTGPIYVISMSTVSRLFAKNRGLALGIVSSGSSIGMISVSLISAFLLTHYGWQNSYLILSLVAFFIMIPCGLVLKKPSAMSKVLQNTGYKHNEKSHELSAINVTTLSDFWLLISVLFLLSFCSYAVLTHIVPHAIDLGVSPIEAASMLSFIGIGSFLGRLVMGRVSDIIGSKQGMLICSILIGATMLWLIASSSLWMLYIFTIAFGFGFGATAPLNAALIGDCFGLRHVGLIMGMIEIGWGFGAACGPALTGFVFDICGNYFPAFLGGGIAALLAAALILFIHVPKTDV